MLVQQAVQAMNTGTPNYTIAVADYTAAITLDPNNSSLYGSLGTADKDDNNFTGAETAFTKATTLNPKDAQDFANLGATYDADGQKAKAVTAYASAVQIAPTNAGYEYSYGVDLINDGNTKDTNKAINACEQAIANAGSNTTLQANAYVAMGFADDNVQDYSDAAKAVSQATKELPTDGQYEEYLGNDYHVMGDYTDAVTAYTSAVNLGDTTSESLYINRGVDEISEQTAAGKNAGLADEEHALAMDPTDPNASMWVGVAYINESTVDPTGSKTDLASAVSNLSTALNEDPTNENAKVNLGYAEELEGNDAAAKQDYDAVLANNDNPNLSTYAKNLEATLPAT